MELISTPVRIPEEKIRGKAKGKGGLIGKVLLWKQPMTLLRLEYLKFYRFAFSYDVTVRVFPAKKRDLTGKIEIIVDAMTGKCAVNDIHIDLCETEGRHFMDGRFDMEVPPAHDLAQGFAKRIVMRLTKGTPIFGECLEPEYFYRPYYIAYYGDPEDKACRFLHFEADGHTFKR